MFKYTDKNKTMGFVSMVGAMVLALVPNFSKEDETGVDASEKDTIENISYRSSKTSGTQFEKIVEDSSTKEDVTEEQDTEEQKEDDIVSEVEEDNVQESDTNEATVSNDVDNKESNDALAPSNTDSSNSSTTSTTKVPSTVQSNTKEQNSGSSVVETNRNDKAEANRKAEEEARRKANEEAKRKAEEEARRKAEEAARIKAEEEARRKAEEEARKEAENKAPVIIGQPNTLTRNGQVVGTRVHGSRFTYTGDKSGLKYHNTSGESHNVTLSQPVLVYDNGRDSNGRDRTGELNGSWPVIINDLGNGMYELYIMQLN